MSILTSHSKMNIAWLSLYQKSLSLCVHEPIFAQSFNKLLIQENYFSFKGLPKYTYISNTYVIYVQLSFLQLIFWQSKLNVIDIFLRDRDDGKERTFIYETSLNINMRCMKKRFRLFPVSHNICMWNIFWILL